MNRSRLRKCTECRYSSLELVAAVIIFGILLTTYVSLLHGLRRAQFTYAQESHGLIVLENVVEQLAALQEPKELDVRQLLRAEFVLAQIPRKDALEASATNTGKSIELAIRRKDTGYTVAKVEIPHEE